MEEVPKLNLDPTVACADALAMQIFGILVFIIWCIVPFLVLSMQLIRFKRKGTLSTHIEESAEFRILYGWAAAKYRSDSKIAFLWEVVNAAIKVIMVFSSVVMSDNNRRVAQAITIAVSFISHARVLPYKNNGTIIILIFSVVNFIGIFATEHFILQIVFIVLTLWVLMLVVFIFKWTAQAALEEKELNGFKSDAQMFTFLERFLMCPFLGFVFLLNKLTSLVFCCTSFFYIT